MDRIREVCRYMETSDEEKFSLEQLSARAGLSAFHFQRKFKAAVGLTPKQYADAIRLKRLKRGLKDAKPATAAIYDAGYGSPSRVYEKCDSRLGMTPGQYRDGGGGIAISYGAIETSLGPMMIGATDRGLCFLHFGGSKQGLLRALREEYPRARISAMPEPAHAQFRAWTEAIRAYVAGSQSDLRLPLDVRATAFQMRVWNYLQTIPYGRVKSYGEVAAAIGRPKAVRAVARACAMNKVALVIPCHRVIRGTGELGGYRGGIATKRALLDRERAAAGPFRPAGRSC